MKTIMKHQYTNTEMTDSKHQQENWNTHTAGYGLAVSQKGSLSKHSSVSLLCIHLQEMKKTFT